MNAGRPALAAASAGVTICRARKLKIVGIFCVRGGTRSLHTPPPWL
jgi:hypothetical protein